MKRIWIALALALAVAGTASAQQFYKWKDENGAWHYTNTPPPKDKQAQALHIVAGERKLVVTEEQTGQPGKPPAAATDAAGGKPAGDKPAAGPNNPNCERAKANVTTLETHTQVSMDKSGTGKNEPLTQDEQMVELQKARKQVEVYCTGSPSPSMPK